MAKSGVVIYVLFALLGGIFGFFYVEDSDTISLMANLNIDKTLNTSSLFVWGEATFQNPIIAQSSINAMTLIASNISSNQGTVKQFSSTSITSSNINSTQFSSNTANVENLNVGTVTGTGQANFTSTLSFTDPVEVTTVSIY